MPTMVDARGLSCPQPVIMALEAMRKEENKELVVLVDTDTARENVSRAAAGLGWQVVEIVAEDDGYRITIGKG
ncbi:SirA-like domain-containing protein [Desulfobulbus propionicus DSM 2032]|jgi:Predicted redox protein, regulator of disulfide bond formation|uniref:SirA-like domain-containing protein n=1 Tax=Desulfobulbus propionicus (strain ATCC 33891 / DSM 2032 / VKM B-1956 / 1pr3) TaxID=577650 RepID=A0A7U4DN45_DESPD|nr:sulfurtransferase TusA family protein [Desulfobulbus propionicus]ADW16644.1 SirA-like domain-containing protein [Desulfobulbus propionicus DSM 2032]